MGMGGFAQGLGAERMDGFEMFGAELRVEEDELDRGWVKDSSPSTGPC